MEDVKTKATLHEPDIRRTMRVVINRRTGSQRPFTFDDLEARVQDIPIPPGAPEEIKDLLATAKNLLLYSWYYYPFSMSASLQAAAALEQALRLGATIFCRSCSDWSASFAAFVKVMSLACPS